MSAYLKDSPRRTVVIGALAAVTVLAAILLRPSADGYVVRAEFKDAAGLRKNSDVKIGGVPGGKISSITLTGRDTAMVSMRLKDGAVPVGAGASAEARPVNLLGEKYVDLKPGDLRRPVPSGTTIGLRRTAAPVELDDVLNMLDPTTRARLRVIVNEVGVGTRGRSTDMNALLDRMPGSLREARALVSSFAADTDRIRRLARDGDRVMTSFNRGKDDLAGLVDVAERTLRATNANRADLGHTIGSAPGTLRQLRTTLRQLDSASARLEPAAVALRQVARPLDETLTRLPALAGDARPALVAARRVAPTLERLGREGGPVVARLEPLSRELERFSTVLAPLSKVLDEQTNPLLRVFEGWARTIQPRDASGHLFRTEVVPDAEMLTHLVGKVRTRKPADRSRDAAPPPAGSGARPAEAPPVRKVVVPKPDLTPELLPKTGEKLEGGINQLLDYLLG